MSDDDQTTRLYVRRYLADRGPLRGIDDDAEEGLERFGELADGALAGH